LRYNFKQHPVEVIDDDDIRVSAAQHTVASTAQVLAEREEVAAGWQREGRLSRDCSFQSRKM